MDECHHKRKDQEWRLLTTNQIQHVDTGLCLDTKGSMVGDDLVAMECDKNSKTQKWLFEFNQRNGIGKIPSDFNGIFLFLLIIIFLHKINIKYVFRC